MKMLLHACCGPCSLEPSRILRDQGYDLTIFYANSNIAPADEYTRRLETLRTWARQCDIEVQEGLYNPAAWQKTAGRIGEEALIEAQQQVDMRHTPNTLTKEEAATLVQDPQKRAIRCRACYRLRLEEAACHAAQLGFEAISTTLAVSPYQYSDIIQEELNRAAAKVGIQAVFEDFRPYYQQATELSRNLGMYRQNYCGCLISKLESFAERAQRKAERAAQKQAERAAHASEIAAHEAELKKRRAERAAYDAKQTRKRAILKELRAKNKA